MDKNSIKSDFLAAKAKTAVTGQKDPLLEFKHESFSLFERFSHTIRQEIVRDLFRFEMMPQTPQQRLQQTLAQLQRQRQAALPAAEPTPAEPT